jgi:hypothetical protein
MFPWEIISTEEKWQSLPINTFSQTRNPREIDKTLLIHTCNTDIYKHSFIPRSTIDWNSLPEATVANKTVDRLEADLLKRD